VEAWIELAPEDMLFVEGAEDFDRIGKDEVTAVQVKDDRASGPLTLGRANAVAALGNFWRLAKANRGRKIRFQFVTTAEAGSEKGGFEGRRAIEVWNLCAGSAFDACADDVSRIRTFLIKRQSLDGSLKQFLKSAPDEEIFQRLIRPFEWLYDQPGLDAMVDLVVGKLLDLGRQRELTSKDARRLANTLHMMVVAAAIKKPLQALTFIGLMEQLEQAVNVELPRGLVRRLGASGADPFDRLVVGALRAGESE
jgi:hypothetical protein